MPKKLHKSQRFFIFYKYPRLIILSLIILLSFSIFAVSLYQTKSKQKVNNLPAKAESEDNIDSENNSISDDNIVSNGDISLNNGVTVDKNLNPDNDVVITDDVNTDNNETSDNENNSPENFPTDGVSQKVEVTIGISKQMVDNHCMDQKLDNDGLCDKVRQLALRDINKVRENFQGTLKTFDPILFDKPFDQSTTPPPPPHCQRHDSRATQYYIPIKACSQKPNSLYIVIFFSEGTVKTIQAEALWGLPTIYYFTPAVVNGVDYWATSLDSGYVLSHEFSHQFGQIHTPYIPPDNNTILKNFEYPEYYSDTLLYKPGDNMYDWVFQQVKYHRITGGDHPRPWNDVPQQIELTNLRKPNGPFLDGGTFVIYGSKERGELDQDILPDPRSDKTVFQGNHFSFPGNLLSKYAILLIVIEDNKGERYYTWFSLMDANIAFWGGKSGTAQFSKRLYQPEKSVIKINVSSKLSQKIQTRILFVKESINTVNGTENIITSSGGAISRPLEASGNISIVRNNLYDDSTYRIYPMAIAEVNGNQVFINGNITSCPRDMVANDEGFNTKYCRLNPNETVNIEFDDQSLTQEIQPVPTPDISPTPLPLIYPKGTIMGYLTVNSINNDLLDEIVVTLQGKADEPPKQVSIPISDLVNQKRAIYSFSDLNKNTNYAFMVSPMKNGSVLPPSQVITKCENKDLKSGEICNIFPPAKVDFQLTFN